jgi:hypothetical protein
MKKSLCASTAALAPDKNLAHQTLIQALKIALIGATIIVLAEGSSIAARVLITGVAALFLATGAAHANPDAPYPKVVKTEKYVKKPAGIARECVTKFSSDGKFENEKEAKACVRAWNGTIANPTKGHWRWIFPPPAEYNIPYTGVLMIQRLPIEQVHKVCWEVHLACTLPISTDPNGRGAQININGNRAGCLIVMPTDDYIKQHTAQDPSETLRHELAHCNGWPGDHPNSQSKWEWVEK